MKLAAGEIEMSENGWAWWCREPECGFSGEGNVTYTDAMWRLDRHRAKEHQDFPS